MSILIQVLAYSPILVIFSVIRAITAIRRHDKGQLLLVMSGTPILLLFLFSGEFQRIDFHWPALGWIILMPVAVNAIHLHRHR